MYSFHIQHFPYGFKGFQGSLYKAAKFEGSTKAVLKSPQVLSVRALSYAKQEARACARTVYVMESQGVRTLLRSVSFPILPHKQCYYKISVVLNGLPNLLQTQFRITNLLFGCTCHRPNPLTHLTPLNGRSFTKQEKHDSYRLCQRRKTMEKIDVRK